VAQNPTDAIVARLETDWPRWQIWYVPRALDGMIWCARLWDGTGDTINAGSPDELAGLLEDEAQP
jgi:hypothetical protein